MSVLVLAQLSAEDAKPTLVIAQLLVLFLGVGLHEYAHCKFADLAGDPTPRYYGRVTLNLFKHFEITGTIMMIITVLAGFGLGWGKPSPMDPRKMKNPRWDWFVAVLAGPVSNFLQAIVYAILFRLAIQTNFLATLPDEQLRFFLMIWLFFGVAINIGLGLFNLIPFGPLDGHWLLGLLLPEKQRLYWFRFNSRVGVPGLFIVILLLQLTHTSLMLGPIEYLSNLLLGPALQQSPIRI